jgi:hypothetical protein
MESYESLSGREANTLEVGASNEDSLAADTVGKGLGDISALGVVVELWMGEGGHCYL